MVLTLSDALALERLQRDMQSLYRSTATAEMTCLLGIRLTEHECRSEIGTVLAYIYNGSLAQGSVPDDWRQANVTPIDEKG